MFIGIFFVILGIGLFVLTIRGLSYSKLLTCLIAGYFILFGSLLTIAIACEWAVMTGYVIGCGIGFIFLATAAFNIYKVFSCSTQIEGTFCGSHAYRSRYITNYAPVFLYEVEDKSFRRQGSMAYSKHYLNKRYQIDEKYPIFINAKKPGNFVIKRSINFGTWNLLFWGVLFCMIPICFMH